MNYQVFDPCDQLSAFVKCYWTLESITEKVPERQTIVPDGCMEMIFHYGDLYRQYTEDGNYIIQPKCFVFGQLTRPLEIEPTGKTGIFSVRFHHNGFFPFATIPIKEMENSAVPLEKLFGNSGLDLGDKLVNAGSTSERINLIEAFFLEKCTDIATVDRVVKSTVETMMTANGQLSVDAISRQKSINRRQLERKFSSAIGLSPKQLSKTIRLQATLKMLLNKQFTSLTALAYENDYYDQAHFIKDFKELTGFTPREFYGDNLQMSMLFYGKE
ncbi:MAG: helix-turn-helix transcriptional regulator [Chitinophagaceae bacterium]|nr:helix-turn-helix transcriptional regulator [Chitinophagaceae bacterium]